jgi:acetoin utilization deacetylase AcuC-like enzyme
VHTRPYLDKLKKATLSPQEILTLELPYSAALVEASRICVGGTILTAKTALEEGACVHLGGGFHHAFADHGEGFCLLNDVACAAKSCLKQGGIRKVLILDCDLHQGNGTAQIFQDCRDVFTFSIHQENNYPAFKPPGDLDIGLDDGTADQEYLTALKENLPRIFERFKPELVFYIAGADPYQLDQLGGLFLSLAGLSRRDELVLTLVKENGAALAVVFGGGYAVDINDTVIIHYNTARLTLEAFT